MRKPRVVFRSNPPTEQRHDDVPSDNELRQYRSRREIAHLKSELVRVTAQKRYKNRALEQAIDTLRLGLDCQIWPTVGGWLKLLQQFQNAYSYEGPDLTDEYEPLFRSVDKDKARKARGGK